MKGALRALLFTPSRFYPELSLKILLIRALLYSQEYHTYNSAAPEVPQRGLLRGGALRQVPQQLRDRRS